MHENGESASLGTIEEVPAGDLTDEHLGRPVSFPYAKGRTHGALTNLSPTTGGDMALVINGQMFLVEGDTPVRVIVQTAAERRTEILKGESA